MKTFHSSSKRIKVGALSLRHYLDADWASVNILTRLACLVPWPPGLQ